MHDGTRSSPRRRYLEVDCFKPPWSRSPGHHCATRSALEAIGAAVPPRHHIKREQADPDRATPVDELLYNE